MMGDAQGRASVAGQITGRLGHLALQVFES